MKSAFTCAFSAMGILLGIVHLIHLYLVMILDLNIILILRMIKLQIRKIRQFNTHFVIINVIVVQSLRNITLFMTPWTAAHQASFPVLHYLPEFAQTHVHQVSDAIQPSHPLSPPSPPALHLSQHHGLFQWVGSLHQAAKELQLQHQSFQWIFRVDFL